MTLKTLVVLLSTCLLVPACNSSSGAVDTQARERKFQAFMSTYIHKVMDFTLKAYEAMYGDLLTKAANHTLSSKFLEQLLETLPQLVQDIRKLENIEDNYFKYVTSRNLLDDIEKLDARISMASSEDFPTAYQKIIQEFNASLKAAYQKFVEWFGSDLFLFLVHSYDGEQLAHKRRQIHEFIKFEDEGDVKEKVKAFWTSSRVLL